MARVLIIGDTHCPCLLDNYVEFLVDIWNSWSCDRVVHIGDLVDNCALSFHLKKPQLKDPLAEYELALAQIDQITKTFPEVDLLLGNHDVLPYRWCDEVGIPVEMMKSFSDIFHLPAGWTVHERYKQIEIDGVIYQHGDRGRSTAILNAKSEFRSVVQGHHHSKAGVEYFANRNDRIFALSVGCGINAMHAQMDYGIKFSAKPIVGAGVVIDGTTAVFEPMIL